jgi:hypothetical protein
MARRIKKILEEVQKADEWMNRKYEVMIIRRK